MSADKIKLDRKSVRLPADRVRLTSGSSFSGFESNHWFMNRAGQDFVDLSGLSGVDHKGDSRVAVHLDFDRDGWTDIALVNANRPLLQVFRNRLGDQTAKHGTPRHSVELAFVGGNHTSNSSALSAREGYGARVEAHVGDLVLHREHNVFQGFGGQSSARMVLGLGTAETIDRLVVRWPSGKVTECRGVKAGSSVMAYEAPGDGAPEFVIRAGSSKAGGSQAGSSPEPAKPEAALQWELSEHTSRPPARIRIYQTVATWCASCKRQLPQLKELRSAFDDDEVEIVGVPIDPADTREMLVAYREEYEPAYRLLVDLSTEERRRVVDFGKRALKSDGVPMFFIVDPSGVVLESRWGAPSVSEIRRWLK